MDKQNINRYVKDKKLLAKHFYQLGHDVRIIQGLKRQEPVRNLQKHDLVA